MKPENISLYYKDPSSDKEYHLTLEASSSYHTSWTGWTVKARYGARGSTLTHVDRTRGTTVTFAEAKELYDSIVKEKKAKGYKTTQSGLSWSDQYAITKAIESDGFDYAFTHKSAWGGVYNAKFHQARREYVEARNKLARFLDMNEEVSQFTY